jgi:hypothetical protein
MRRPDAPEVTVAKHLALYDRLMQTVPEIA